MRTMPVVFTLLLSIGSLAASTPVLQQTLPSAPEPQKTANLNPDLDGIYHISKEVTIPKLIYSVEPEFSEPARKRKISANIKVKFIVDKDGSTRNFTVVRSAAENMADTNKAERKDREAALSLDPKAIEAVRQYRFEPATFQGKPVPCWLTIEVNFVIF